MRSAITWQVPLQHPAFAGHFPGTPIFPGVLLLDVVVHALVSDGATAPATCEIRTAKFFNPARPGDLLLIHHQPSTNNAIRFEITCGVRKIATGDLLIPPRA